MDAFKKAVFEGCSFIRTLKTLSLNPAQLPAF